MTNDIFISKFDNTGNLKWISSLGGAGDEYNQTANYEGKGTVLMSGAFSDSLRFADTEITHAHDRDFFLSRFFDCDCNRKIKLGKDTSVCEQFLLKADSGFVSYHWENGSSARNRLITNSGIYQITVTDTLGCISADSISVTVNPRPVFSLGNDLFISTQDSALIAPDRKFSVYQWNTGSMQDKITVYGQLLGVGMFDIILNAVDSFGCSASDDLVVTVNEAGRSFSKSVTSTNNGFSNSGDKSLKTGNPEILSADISVYPNPSNGNFTIETSRLTDSPIVEIQITDESGQTVYEKTNIIAGNINITLKTAGVYTVNVKAEGKIYTEKVVVN